MAPTPRKIKATRESTCFLFGFSANVQPLKARKTRSRKPAVEKKRIRGRPDRTVSGDWPPCSPWISSATPAETPKGCSAATIPTNQAGAICSPGLEILEFIYPRLKQHGMQGVYVYGQPPWGVGGVSNYLLAKLAWDPDADVEALFVEYMQRAYHEGAPEIEQIYRLMDAELKRHFIENDDARV